MNEVYHEEETDLRTVAVYICMIIFLYCMDSLILHVEVTFYLLFAVTLPHTLSPADSAYLNIY